MVIFEWDENKARANLRKHGIAFEDALLVFDDPDALSGPDRDEGVKFAGRRSVLPTASC